MSRSTLGTGTLDEFIQYLERRAKENMIRAGTAKWSNDRTWYAAKADTYYRCTEKAKELKHAMEGAPTK